MTGQHRRPPDPTAGAGPTGVWPHHGDSSRGTVYSYRRVRRARRRYIAVAWALRLLAAAIAAAIGLVLLGPAAFAALQTITQ